MTSVRYEELRPAPRWRRRIECFWHVQDPTSTRHRAPERVMPDGCPELIVHLADRFSRLDDGAWRRQAGCFLAGTLSRPWHLRGGATLDTFGIRFRPGALPAVLPIDMRSAVDREVPLAELAGRSAARKLRAGLATATSLRDRARLAEAWLDEVTPGESPATRRGETAVAAILESRGTLRIEGVAARLGLSRRQVERDFAQDLGIRPKLFARIVRLQHALLAFASAERAAGADIALAAGYFDQAHLLRDFQALAGRTASRSREEDGAMARHFSAPERLLQLLEGE